MPNIIETERKMRNRGRWLCVAGWLLFAVSLALPAFHAMGWLSGWECFRVVFDMTWAMLKEHSEWAFYLPGFAMMNCIFLASPLFIRLFRHDLRWLRRCALVMASATLYVASYPFSGGLAGLREIGSFGIGYYAWVMSFGLVTAGALHLSIRRRNAVINERQTELIRTPEEMRAVRELEDYLRGIDRPNVSTPACVSMN